MLTADEIVARARWLADEVLFPESLATDASAEVPGRLLDALAEAGFYGLFSSPDVGGLGADADTGEDVISLLAGGCLTTTFVWMQHLATSALVSRLSGPIHDTWARPLARGERRAGIAFSHLRHAGEPAVTAVELPGGYEVSGTAPLVTGWGLVDVVHVAARTGGDIAWLLVDAEEAPTLVTRRLQLTAVDASATVVLSLYRHFVPESRLTHTQSLEDWLEKDAAGLRTNGALSLGVASRCLALLGPSALDAELMSVRHRLRCASVAEMPAARARASLLVLEAASALIVAGGGRSMVRSEQAQLLGREALFLLVQGQTAPIRAAQLSPVVARTEPPR